MNKYNIGKKKLIGIGIFVILFLIILPLTIIQVQKQQQIKQRAEGLNNVYLELTPLRDGKNAIDTQFVQTLYLQNPLNKDISGVDITLTYNKDYLDVVDFNTELNLSDVVKDTSIPGEVHYVGVNSRQTHVIDSTIPLGAFILKAKKKGNGTIDFSKVTITATGETQPLEPAYNKSGSYEIVEKSSSTIALSEDINNDKKINKDDVDNLISHYGETGGAFDLNNDGIVDGVDYNILLRAGNSNPATLAFIDFIQGSFEEELAPLMPHKVKGFGGAVYSATSFLEEFSLVFLAAKQNRVADLVKQISVYELVRNEAEVGRSLDDILKQYSEFVEVSGGKTDFSEKGRSFVKKKYDDLFAAHDKQCEELRDKPVKERSLCLFYPYGGKDEYYPYSSTFDPVIQDILNVKNDEIRILKELGNPEPLLRSLASYDRVTRNGNEGIDQGLEVYYQLAKRFDDKREYQSALEIYDAIATNAPASEIGRLSKERIEKLHSFGHQSRRVFYNIGAGLADPTIIIPINICGPGSVGCKLVGKVLLKSGIITKNVAKFGAEKTAQLLVGSYGIKREAAEAVVEASSKLAKNEAGSINLGKIVTVKKTMPGDVASAIPEILEDVTRYNQDDIQREIQSITKIKGSDAYRNQFLKDLEKKGGYTIKTARDVLGDRALKYVDHYAKIGFISTSNAKTFRQTVGRLVEDLVEEVGRNADGSINIPKLMKIDELTHKTVAAVSNLEHVASGQRFSNHSYSHLHENLSKALSAIETHQRSAGSSPFTRRDKIYMSFISFIHDIGYSDADIIQRPLNFFETKKHPQRAYEFVRAELQKDLKDVLGEKSALIVKETLESDMEDVVGKEGAATIMDAIRKHGDKTFTYSSKNLNGNKRLSALFALADDLAVDKVPDFARYPEIAKIITEFFQASKKQLAISNEIDTYIAKLKQFRDIKDSSPDGAAKIYQELMEMDHGDTVLGRFRTGYRQQMQDALEKYRSSIPDVRFRQYKQAIETTTEAEFPFTISPAIIEKTSFSIVNLPDGKIGAHVIMEISEPLYLRLSKEVGEKNAKEQITKIMEDLVLRSSDEPLAATKELAEKKAKELAKGLFENGSGQLGPGNDIVIKFVKAQRGADVLRDISK